MEPVQVFASTYGRVLTIGASIAALIAVVSIAVSDGAGELVHYGAILLLVAAVVWATFWYPRVTVSDGGVEVRNVLRTVHVPWPAFRSVSVAYSLEVRTSSLSVTAWAAPRASGTAMRMTRRGAERRRPGGATAEVVAGAIEARYAALAAAGHLEDAAATGEAHGIRATSTWNVPVLAVVGSLVVLAGLGLALG